MNKLKEFKEKIIEFKDKPILTFHRKLLSILYGIEIEKNSLGYTVKINNKIIGIYKNLQDIKVKDGKLIIKYLTKGNLTVENINLNDILDN